ncbi:MAG: hypothetical protein A2Z14_19960 [Chloroflexi bacterium RBG_16_48_8]|nr:MAG: hypothetical protein A2Z14_19960 [Chloroflexi bacterium RBG_16_48_8]
MVRENAVNKACSPFGQWGLRIAPPIGFRLHPGSVPFQQGANQMKKVRLFILIVIGILSLTSCIVDDSWLGLVGRWQDVENPSFELEFTKGGKFNEYLFNGLIGYGDFYPEGDIITLHYESPCGGENQVSCDVSLSFTVTEETLIITDNQGDIRFSKVSSSQ